ncbi:MAG TPA: cytosine permease [Baekduia sp.]|uniref:purine-cytosine permease family protein n=1 Tax=Baekduia sp. TaxID=2600305 RepID=UPI002D798C81|nr:cytosine permease [Baekduia sp.]HET6509689.1 cytosine permease [Baekduia sp.]
MDEETRAARGAIEEHGVEPIPVRDRTAGAGEFFRIAVGATMTTTTVVLGTLPVAMGLSFRAALTAIVLGVVAGAVVLMPLAIFGPRTHTNNAVTSGAHFGVTGRIVGSFLSLLIAITFFTISVWVGGDALAAGLARLAPGLRSGWTAAAGYALTGGSIFAICVVGYRWLLAASRLIAPLFAALLLLGVPAFAGHFHLGAGPSAHGYAVGGFAATWTAALLIVMANGISYGPFLGDWSRYVPETESPRRLMAATFLSQLASLVPFVFGAATATLVPDPANYVAGLVGAAPDWYVVALVVVVFAGSIAGGAASLYGTGLDFSSVVPAFSRLQATLTIGTVSIMLVFLGRFVFNMVDTVDAFTTLILIFSAPWTAVMLIGAFTRRGHYLADDLQVFNRGQRGGAYWFTGGFNARALAAWGLGAATGLLLANTTLVAGPLRNVAGGVDLSFFASLAVSGAVYLALLLAFPEPRHVFGPRGPRLVPCAAAEAEAPAIGVRPEPVLPLA